jgi:hypothetical protein
MPLQIPLSVNEGLIEKFYARSQADGERVADVALTEMSSAMKEARTAIERVAALNDALSKDATLLPAARAVRLREVALGSSTRVAKRLDAAARQTRQELEKIRRETSAPPKPPGLSESMASEIRSVLRGMNSKDRGSLLHKSITNDDAAIVHSVLSAPGFLSGLDDSEFGMRRAAYRSRAHPTSVDREDRLRRALEATERAGKALVEFTESAIGPEANAAEAAANRVRDAVNAATGAPAS